MPWWIAVLPEDLMKPSGPTAVDDMAIISNYGNFTWNFKQFGFFSFKLYDLIKKKENNLREPLCNSPVFLLSPQPKKDTSDATSCSGAAHHKECNH